MRIILIAVVYLLCATFTGYASDISKVEYYFDNDPGYGLGIEFPMSPGVDLDLNHTIDITSLEDGFHILYIRAQDSDDVWSIRKSHPFLKSTSISTDPLPDITDVEYYFDTDPGYGNGNSVSFPAAADVAVNLTADTDLLTDGLHILYMRARDEHGRWSMPESWPVVLLAMPDITMVEYFLDNDPGYGSGVQVNYTPGDDVDIQFTVNLEGVPAGQHTLYLRCENEFGHKSLLYAHEFIVTTDMASITGVIKADAFGNSDLDVANAVITLDGTQYQATTNVNGEFILSDIPDGTYTVTISSPEANPQTMELTVSNGNDVVLTNIPKLTLITQSEYEQAVVVERDKWDANNDNRIGLEEAINALRVISGGNE